MGQANAWHEVVRLNLKKVESNIPRYMDGRETVTQLQTRLRDAWQHGKVPGLDGKMLTGQRNLDAKAQKVLNKLLALLKRTGVLK